MKAAVSNRKAYYNYTIEEEFEAGLVLLGSEVKAIRESRVNINDSYIVEENGQLIVVNLAIGFSKTVNMNFCHEERRKRLILLHQKEIKKLIGKINIKGYSLIPLKIFFNKRNIAKMVIGLAKGKKLYDKREAIKKRDEIRAAARSSE